MAGKWTLFYAAILLALSSTYKAKAQEEGTLLTQGCLTSEEFDPNRDYFEGAKFEVTDYFPIASTDPYWDTFPNKVNRDVTTDLFSITYHNYYKIVTNHQVNKTYLLYLCGTEDQLPASELDGRHHLTLSVPHQGGVAVTSTTQIPFLELLGLRREIIANINNPALVSSPCLKYMMNVENSTEIVIDLADPYNSTATALLTAQFLQENPDAIIFGGAFSDGEGDREVAVAATLERTNVATFDWIGFYAAFFNLEALSNKIAAETKARYDCSSSNAAKISAGRAVEEQPVVLWASYYPGFNWSVAECPVWDYTYYCEYAQHCGATVLTKPEGLGNLNDDQLLQLGKDADYFVYSGFNWDSVYAEKKELLDQIKAVQNEQVYDVQGAGSNAWFEQRLAEYEVVALDFCDMIGVASNTGTGEPHTRQWLRNVATEPIGSLPECQVPDEIDQPYVPRGAECSLLQSGDLADEESDMDEEQGDVDEPTASPSTIVDEPTSAPSSMATAVFSVSCFVSALVGSLIIGFDH